MSSKEVQNHVLEYCDVPLSNISISHPMFAVEHSACYRLALPDDPSASERGKLSKER